MKKATLSTIFNIEKGTLQSTKNEAGDYHFITASSEWKTHNKYEYDCEAIVVAVSASGSLGRVHYVRDKFIASDLCFVLTVKDDYRQKVNPLYYFYLLSGQQKELIALAKGAAKKSINKKDFSNYEVMLPSFEQQNEIAQKFLKAKDLITSLLFCTTKAENDVECLQSLMRNKITVPVSQITSPLAISSFLVRNKNTITVDDDKTYKRLTIRMHAKGVAERDTLTGVKIGTKRQYVVSAGQLVISKIDARQGAFGIVPPDCDGAITTADFLSFNIDRDVILPEVLNELLQSKHIAELFQKSSQGATNRKRFNEKVFLSQIIDVPNQNEQKAMMRKFALLSELKNKLSISGDATNTLYKKQLQAIQI